MTKANLEMLRRATDPQVFVSPFAPFPTVLAPPTNRDYTQVPAYEMPVLRMVRKVNDVQGWTRLHVARRIDA